MRGRQMHCSGAFGLLQEIVAIFENPAIALTRRAPTTL
jgi:hypothetical protein